MKATTIKTLDFEVIDRDCREPLKYLPVEFSHYQPLLLCTTMALEAIIIQNRFATVLL
jgi:hypothetical protein